MTDRCLHHVTMTTGHSRKSDRSEVGDNVVELLSRTVLPQATGGEAKIPAEPPLRLDEARRRTHPDLHDWCAEDGSEALRSAGQNLTNSNQPTAPANLSEPHPPVLSERPPDRSRFPLRIQTRNCGRLGPRGTHRATCAERSAGTTHGARRDMDDAPSM